MAAAACESSKSVARAWNPNFQHSDRERYAHRRLIYQRINSTGNYGLSPYSVYKLFQLTQTDPRDSQRNSLSTIAFYTELDAEYDQLVTDVSLLLTALCHVHRRQVLSTTATGDNADVISYHIISS